jgi:hypothetical protein
MRTQAGMLLALAFAFPAVAQTEAQPRASDGATESLWKIETSGIGG